MERRTRIPEGNDGRSTETESGEIEVMIEVAIEVTLEVMHSGKAQDKHPTDPQRGSSSPYRNMNGQNSLFTTV